ncbi:MAG: hypothetical protein AB7D57_08430 [Desulfovibrionaceae bacterium]
MADDDNKSFHDTVAALVKGVMLGGSLGGIVGWTGILPFWRALGLGMLVGCLASLTVRDRLSR